MANPTHSSKKDDFPIYSGAEKAVIRHLMGKLEQYLSNIVEVLRIESLIKSSDEISYTGEVLFELLNRVEMRKIYFHVFHKGMDMGELNEGCLLCFWILKFMPFEHETIPTQVLNVKIALCLFLNMLTYVASKRNKTVNKSMEIIRQLSYTFKYRDLSKEALMMIAEALIIN
ncbi:hypothetical protein ACYULU_07560 [Breznakiellaceae bacterium SP9]